jgi:hypothetical protein
MLLLLLLLLLEPSSRSLQMTWLQSLRTLAKGLVVEPGASCISLLILLLLMRLGCEHLGPMRLGSPAACKDCLQGLRWFLAPADNT